MKFDAKRKPFSQSPSALAAVAGSVTQSGSLIDTDSDTDPEKALRFRTVRVGQKWNTFGILNKRG